MRTVDRYRAWALRGSFRLDSGDNVITVRWPATDALLAYDQRDSTARRLVHLAGDAAEDILLAVGDEDGEVLALIIDDLAEYFGCTRGLRLSRLIDRYGDSISADLDQNFQFDVLDVLRGLRVPDEAMERIDKLPRHSRLSEALAQDDELAAATAVDGDGESVATAPTVRHTEMTPEAERIARTNDLLGAILTAIGSFGGARVNIPPEPRPVDASERLQAQREDDEFRDLEADVEAAQARHAELHPDEP